MDYRKRLGLINALRGRPADTPTPGTPRGLLGLDSGRGALSSYAALRPRLRRALAQALAKSEHDRLVEKLRARLVANPYSDIRVDLPGYVKPTRIVWTRTQRGHEPDASAYYGFKEHIFEVETAETIADEHTREQCELFAAYVRDRYAQFTLVVPSGYRSTAFAQLTYWGLTAAVADL